MEAQIATVPNALSGLRLLLVPVIGWLVASGGHDRLAVALLIVAGFTDWLDGFLARRWNQVTAMGVLLDPLADRLAILTFAVALTVRGILPLWAAAAIGLRDLVLACTLPALRARGRWALPVTRVGKAATFGLLSSFPLLYIAHTVFAGIASLSLGLTGLSVALYWAAGAGYLRQVAVILRGEPR